MFVINLSVLVVSYGALATLLSWNLGPATVLLLTIGSKALSLEDSLTFIILSRSLEGVIGALNSTKHCSLACWLFSETSVGS